jgi:dolichol-phosphate mannosyltransferase
VSPELPRFARFALVGGAGYLVNLAVYTTLVHAADVVYIAAATVSFGVAVTHNYLLNRSWTFRDARGAFFGQGARFLVVSIGALGVNLFLLQLFVAAGGTKVFAQAVAIVLALPVNFIGNRLWSFRPLAQPRLEPRVFAPTSLPRELRAVVCLPTYNERENVEAMLVSLRRVLSGRDLVLVIDDDSPDGTGDVSDRVAATLGGVQVMHRAGKEGLGRAYLDGFRHALSLGAELVLEMDCDFSHEPADVPRLIDAAGEADLVLGSRYTAGGGAAGLTFWRKVVSRGGCLYARVVLGVPVRDLTGGFKCYRREALLRLGLGEISASGYVFQIETTYRALQSGARVCEIPIRFGERRLGSSKMGLRIAAEAAWKVPALRMRLMIFPHRVRPEPALAGSR